MERPAKKSGVTKSFVQLNQLFCISFFEIRQETGMGLATSMRKPESCAMFSKNFSDAQHVESCIGLIDFFGNVRSLFCVFASGQGLTRPHLARP